MCMLYVDISMSRYLDEVRSAECHMIGYPQRCLSTLHTPAQVLIHSRYLDIYR